MTSSNKQLQDELNTIFEELNGLLDSNSPADISRRIELCNNALEIIPRQEYPEQWAALQDDLGSSLVEIPWGSRTENLKQAIHHFERALEVRTRQDFPIEWAMTQNNLGMAYRDLIDDRWDQNIERSIYHFQQALDVRIRASVPAGWAMTQS